VAHIVLSLLQGCHLFGRGMAFLEEPLLLRYKPLLFLFELAHTMLGLFDSVARRIKTALHFTFSLFGAA
jgi:hypothetical protein